MSSSRRFALRGNTVKPGDKPLPEVVRYKHKFTSDPVTAEEAEMIARLDTTLGTWPTGKVDNINLACGLALKLLSLYDPRLPAPDYMAPNKWRALVFVCMELICTDAAPFDMGIVKGVCNQGRLGRDQT